MCIPDLDLQIECLPALLVIRHPLSAHDTGVYQRVWPIEKILNVYQGCQTRRNVTMHRHQQERVNMDTITRYLGGDHKRCDELFVQAENCVSDEQWDRAAPLYADFSAALERHLAMEEQVLFPAFEEAAASRAGPTIVMRTEHQQMRHILSQMHAALVHRDASGFLGYSDTLNILMQQHNLKEENILYPMIDRLLHDRQDEMIAAMEDIGAPA